MLELSSDVHRRVDVEKRTDFGGKGDKKKTDRFGSNGRFFIEFSEGGGQRPEGVVGFLARGFLVRVA